jgi:ParB family chromosome partitioning protein
MEKIQSLPVSELQPFPDNPFRVMDGEEMKVLSDSIRESGVITPLLVRPMDGGGYEIVAGHRRIQACKAAGIDKVPAVVRTMTQDEAVIALVDSNLHRERILPSERAFAYRMKLDAMKRQGRRTDLTSTQPVSKLRSNEQLGEEYDESRETVRRYIRLTYLEKPLLDMVDEGRIALTPAVELSYLRQKEQCDLVETIESEDATPSLSQAKRLRSMSEAGTLDMDAIFGVMTETKGNQEEVLKVPVERIRKYVGRDTSYQGMQDFIEKAIEHYCRYLQRQRDRDAR